MKNQLFLELQNSNLDLDRFFNISINHASVRLMSEYSNELVNDLISDNYERHYKLYDEDNESMIEYKKGNIEIVLTRF